MVCSVVHGLFTGTHRAFAAEAILDAGVALWARIQAAAIAIRQVTTNQVEDVA
jgi:hypothetical protein